MPTNQETMGPVLFRKILDIPKNINETQKGPGTGVRRLQCTSDFSVYTGKQRADANCTKIQTKGEGNRFVPLFSTSSNDI